MISLRRTASHLLLLLPLACEPAGYPSVGTNTEPSVNVAYPAYYLKYVDPSLEPVTFGEASADLPITIVGLEDDGRDHVIDLGLPERAVMHGYGAFEGMTETYHRTRLVDSNGVHGVRVAVYRTDTKRGHTNVWTHFLARTETNGVFLTDQSQWDWLGGEQDTAGFSKGAWPFYDEVQTSHTFYNSFFGFTPGVYSRTEYITQVILSTVATSPTYGIEGCVQVLFNSVDPALRHQAYLHERYGLVEMVYKWHDLDSVRSDGNDYPSVPIDGFTAPPSSLQELPELATTTNDLAGIWRGSAQLQDEAGHSLGANIALDLSAVGLAYREPSDSYDVEGTYSEGDLDVHVRGRYYRRTHRLRLAAGRTAHQIAIYGVFAPSTGRLDLQISHVDLDDVWVSGDALLERK